MTMTKFIRVGISPELFVQMFKTGTEHHYEVLEGLPADAQIIDVQFVNIPDRLYVCTYISETQGTLIREGDPLSNVPLTSITMRRVTCIE